MASPEVLDFAKLLAPITPDKATGADPRGDHSGNSPFHQIKDDRRKATELERPGADGVPDWGIVKQLCTKVLTEQAKDLSVAAYLIEALVRTDGFPGLRDGIRLARELVDKYWDSLYPQPEPEDLEREKALKANATPTPEDKEELKNLAEENLYTRTAPLAGLNGVDAEGVLIAPIARVPLTEMTSVGRFAHAQYNEGKSLKKIADPKVLQQKIDAGAVSVEKFQNAVAESKPEFFLALVDDLKACVTEVTKLGEVLDKKCDRRGPPTTNIRNAVQAALEVVQETARDKLAVAQKPATPADGAAPAAAKPATQPGVIQTREQALESLLKVADFFRRTEPHSPISYALDQVVRWGRMSLPELWTELISDDAPRKSVFKQVGIRAPEDKAAPKK